MAERLRGRLLILAAAVLWSTSGFFAKAPWFLEWPRADRGILLAFWRAVFATLVIMPMVRRPRWSWWLVPMTLIFLVMNVTYLSAMTYTTAANAIWLQNTAPLWVFLVGVLVLREPVQASDIWRLVFGLLGVAVILVFEIQGQAPLGILLGLAAGVTYGGVVLCLRYLRDEDPAWLIGLNHLVTALALLPYVWSQPYWPHGQQWWALAGFGMFQMGLPYFLFARGLQHTTGHEAAGITLLEPILVPVWVYLAWRHHPSYQPPQWWTLVGGGLILIGLLLRYGTRRRPATRAA